MFELWNYELNILLPTRVQLPRDELGRWRLRASDVCCDGCRARSSPDRHVCVIRGDGQIPWGWTWGGGRGQRALAEENK